MTLNYSKNDILSVPLAPRVQFRMFLENCWNCWYNHFSQIEAWSVSLKGVRRGARKPVWQGNCLVKMAGDDVGGFVSKVFHQLMKL